ncbi:MAG TPA: hypothetical protein K8V84_13370 [Nocardiopsis listeri]|uniref:hypothetical protein n=1 Tax=Nocardiopsis listeri TaxID=53440 RepID=UPI001DB3F0FB|nr:hypothetical protein [Nocardiopsis listeri]HJE59476.1 hypothetical protein [Nocardiopsis listeri]
MLTTTTHPRRAIVLCWAVLLLATACGTDGHGHSPRRLSEMIAEGVRDSVETGPPGLGTSGSLYDPGDFACAPAVDPQVPGDWRSQAPRVTLEPGEPVEIGLSDAAGGPTRNIVATVTTPDGGTASAEVDLGQDEWVFLVFPDDFDVGPTTSGAHTVLWTDDSGDPVTCDGFEVG